MISCFSDSNGSTQYSHSQARHLEGCFADVPRCVWNSAARTGPPQPTHRNATLFPYASASTGYPDSSNAEKSVMAVTRALSMTSNDRVERPTTTGVPRPDAAHDT